MAVGAPFSGWPTSACSYASARPRRVREVLGEEKAGDDPLGGLGCGADCAISQVLTCAFLPIAACSEW